ncbi:hypothetical protein GCM10010082_03720 [Kushneria pakistanensis]|uniref:Uncharacterized protein n=1 Tax=Kushneria pakistanensis TaxID=1508770 RepID=A0ABQ3FAT7_9GAMM|nr:hypothetical protein GCM10010082_03720 [Kushneria pakistanensis]
MKNSAGADTEQSSGDVNLSKIDRKDIEISIAKSAMSDSPGRVKWNYINSDMLRHISMKWKFALYVTR